MMLIVKEIETGKIHQVIKYLTSTDDHQHVWCATWSGRHTIGKDCEWSNISLVAWSRINVIKSNPEMSAMELSKILGISYTRVFRLVNYYHLTVRKDKGEKKPRPKPRGGNKFNPNKRSNWMM